MRKLMFLIMITLTAFCGCSSKIDLAITSPSDGATINSNSVTVTGTVANMAETGVTINGIPVSLYVNPSDANKRPVKAQFAVNNVPLNVGQNTITVKASDVNGISVTKTITVNGVAPTGFIKLNTFPDSGVAPMEIRLTIDGSFSISSPVITFTGPGTVEQLAGDNPEEYKYKITTEGIYYFTAQAKDPDGNTYSDTIAITVLPLAQMDALLKTKWNGFKNALNQRDIDKAMLNFASQSQDTYKQVYTNLKPILSDVVNELNAATINFISLDNDTAIYEILVTREGTTYSFQLEFAKDESGIWKIYKF